MAEAWGEGHWEEKVLRVEAQHRLPSVSFLDGTNYSKRWVVWLVTDTDARVWVRTVEDDSDCFPLRLRSLLVKEFFGRLIGQDVLFAKYKESYQECYSVDESKLPGDMLLDKFTSIHTWCEENCPEWLKNNLEALRQKRNRSVAETKKRNAEARKEAKKRDAEALEERRRNALKIAFVEGRNPKRGEKQWQALCDGIMLVLARECAYNSTEGAIPIAMVRELVPGKIVLVRRI